MRACSALLLSGFVAALIGCNKNSNTSSDSSGQKGGSEAPAAAADIGPELYKSAGPPVFPKAAAPGREPIVIANCVVQYENRQQVSAEVDGKIEMVASPLIDVGGGRYEWRQPGEAPIVYDPAKPHPSIVFHPRDRMKTEPYWKLSDGSIVAADQVICMLDDQIITTKKKTAGKILEASKQVMKDAKQGVDYVKEKTELTRLNEKLFSRSQVLDDLITYTRFLENLSQAVQAIAKAEQDVTEAELMIDKYQIRSRVSGIIRTVAKRPGEFVRPGEKIFEIQSTEIVRLEGNLDSQYANRVRPNMIAIVEPAVPIAPMTGHTGHRQEVGGVAVTGHADRPLVISAGLDGLVLVWDPNVEGAQDRPAARHSLPHPVRVRAVACTPPGAKEQFVITGADDGKVRIWDLTNPAKLPTAPKSEPGDFHTSGVTAVAVSPDGRFAATAAGREVFVWEIAAGKKLYAVPPEHRDSVTSLSFTPQGTLVTAAKDRMLKVWKLGAKGAAIDRTIEHRSGEVDTLGVSPDGGRMLFDKDKGRIDLVNIADGQTVGQLNNIGQSVSFSTLALFGPDYSTPENPRPYMMLTAGGEGDLKGALQVWQAPKEGGRASEIARLITPGRVTVTCAAFSPHGKSRFLVVGTAAGTVHVWTPPREKAKQHEGRVTLIDPTDPRYFTVRVEMRQPEGAPLFDHSTATVIIDPEQK